MKEVHPSKLRPTSRQYSGVCHIIMCNDRVEYVVVGSKEIATTFMEHFRDKHYDQVRPEIVSSVHRVYRNPENVDPFDYYKGVYTWHIVRSAYTRFEDLKT